MQNDFILAFGKFKGRNFNTTPTWYQKWLMSQEWFKVPTTDPLQTIAKEMSQVARSLRGWDGYSRKGYAAECRMFELEKAEQNAMYCDCGNRKDPHEKNCGCGGIYAL